MTIYRNLNLNCGWGEDKQESKINLFKIIIGWGRRLKKITYNTKPHINGKDNRKSH